MSTTKAERLIADEIENMLDRIDERKGDLSDADLAKAMRDVDMQDVWADWTDPANADNRVDW